MLRVAVSLLPSWDWTGGQTQSPEPVTVVHDGIPKMIFQGGNGTMACLNSAPHFPQHEDSGHRQGWKAHFTAVTPWLPLWADLQLVVFTQVTPSTENAQSTTVLAVWSKQSLSLSCQGSKGCTAHTPLLPHLLLLTAQQCCPSATHAWLWKSSHLHLRKLGRGYFNDFGFPQITS